jgi:GxxExxY protein
LIEPLRHEEHKGHKVGVGEFAAIPKSAEDIATTIVDSALRVHRALGPGLLESVYEACLCHELSRRRVPFQRQIGLPIEYEGFRLESGLRLDILVGNCVVVELKAVESLAPLHEAQLLTYLKLSGCRIGLLLNFNTALMKDGIKRMVL